MWLANVVLWIGVWASLIEAQNCPRHTDAHNRPSPCLWEGEDKRDLFLDWLIKGCALQDGTPPSGCNAPDYRHVEYEGYDGWYNNFAKPSQGAIDTPLLRLLQPDYEDGVYQPVKRETNVNPFNVSETLMKGQNGQYSLAGKTAFLVFFGQQVVEEVLDAQGSGCPPEYFNVKIDKDHEYAANEPHLHEMPLLRTRYDMRTGFSPNNPRQQLNEITPYFDGGLVYGTAKGWADVLRTFSNGTLAPDGKLAWHDELGEGFPAANSQRLPMANPPPPANHDEYIKRMYTAPVNRFFKLGNPRGNENPFLLTFGILWYRWHNHIAGYLRKNYDEREWSAERVFNEARKWVIATYQAVVYYDWLPKYLRQNLPVYTGYRATTDPQISHVFQSAAMRFGHTLVTSGVYLRNNESSDGCRSLYYELSKEGGNNQNKKGVRTCNSFWRSPELFQNDTDNFERFLMGMSSQSTEKEDNIIVEDLRGRVFGPLEFSRRDLMAVNIQRGRDHGLSDYNTARKFFGLPALSKSSTAREFLQITKTDVDSEVIENLMNLYDHKPDEMDIWPAGLMETNKGPGQLFSSVIRDQFERMRDGDRFWFENEKNDLFTTDERDRIKKMRIIDVLMSVTSLRPRTDVQEDPFTAINENNIVGPTCNGHLTQVPCSLWNGENEGGSTDTNCSYLEQLSNDNTESCTTLKTYDHFSGSETSYILTFTFVVAFCVGILIFVLAGSYYKSKQVNKKAYDGMKITENSHKAKERVSRLESRYVVIHFDAPARRIEVRDAFNALLRTLDFTNVKELKLRHLSDYTHMILCLPNHYDLYTKFQDEFHAKRMHHDIEQYCQQIGITLKSVLESSASIQRGIVTYREREKKLEEFSRVVLSNAFGSAKQADAARKILAMDLTHDNFLSMEITLFELANQLGMTPDSLFVKQLFRLMDKDNSGFITIQEFWDVMVIFARGDPEQKSRLIFNIYDISQTGTISSEDFKTIVRTTLGSEGKVENVDEVVRKMIESAGLAYGQSISYEKFKKIFDLKGDIFNKVNIDMNREVNRKESRFSLYAELPVGGFQAQKSREQFEQAKAELGPEQEHAQEVEVTNRFQEWYNRFVNSIKSQKLYIFWLALYTLVMILIFVERAYYYTIEREHGGLRRIAGLGVTVTRGAASAMMFTFSSLLVTMCRNLFSTLRSTRLHSFFPFDHMVEFHRYIGAWALLWTVVHIIGHAFNFYHIATQTPSDLSCLFRDYFRSTHILPKFHYWCWETITGFTGIFLTIQTAVIYSFAYFSRRYFFRLFWITHNSYPIFYIFMILHGSGRLVQDPFFHFFFLGPCILFVLDKLVSVSRNTLQIQVTSATHLPSNVTLLKIRRPPHFNFQSGMWVRIASMGISKNEYHPFTISSAPHEKDLTLHIRAVGPWTSKLRKVYPDRAKVPNAVYPKILIDGPFGEGHQGWWDFEVVVLVGGGIGVTPFASILKDIAHKLKNHGTLHKTKKVMFLWVTRSQKQFEWMTDILRQVEAEDEKQIIRNHIFITQFQSKFDLRTIMLYLAERHFQKISGTSLFTGLRAITHFSRPNFTSVFKTIKKTYDSTPVIGVFTCGSPAISNSVENGCLEANKDPGPLLTHYYANF